MTDTEAHRHACEVRHVLKLGQAANQYLDLVAKRRGDEAASRLRVAAREQWQMGNRGEWGRWETKIAEAA